MNKTTFEKLEIAITTLRVAGNTPQKATTFGKWWQVTDNAASQLLKEASKFGIINIIGKARNTCYALTDAIQHSIDLEMERGSDLEHAVPIVLSTYIGKKDPVTELTLADGRKLVKVSTSKPALASEEAAEAVKAIHNLIKDYEDTKAENALLKEELKRLQDIECKYNQIKALL